MRSLRHIPARSKVGVLDKTARINQIINEVIIRRDSGISIDDNEIEQSYAELMPELNQRLHVLRAIEAARDATRDSGSSQSYVAAETGIEEDLHVLRNALTAYDILERINYGGQGVVYKALQRSTHRMVAIKVLLDGPLASDRQRNRFVREVEIVSRLQHPNIVTLYESGQVRGRHYFAMEYVEGLPIDDYAMLQGLGVRDRIRLIVTACRAVGSVHQHGVIHRDLKPSNILVDLKGSLKVLDFGLAKHVAYEHGASDDSSISATGSVVGTLPYLSPEQLSALTDEVDVRSDIYALGVVTFEMLTGRLPYAIDESTSLLGSHNLSRAPCRLRGASPDEGLAKSVASSDLDHDLAAIISKALEKDKADRYQSVTSLADDFERFLSGDAVEAKAHRRLYTLSKTARRHRVAVSISASCLVVFGALTGIAAYLWLDREAATATGALRVELARDWDVDLLNELQSAHAKANRLAEIADLPLDLIDAHLKRFREEPIGAMQLFDKTLQDKPENLLSLVRSNIAREHEDAQEWLELNGRELDGLAATLETTSVRLRINKGTGFALGAGIEYLSEARAGCNAFVARAYLRHQNGDRTGALADLTAARRLASDLGDGATITQKDVSMTCLVEVYTFMLHALSDGLRNNASTEVYQRWLIADPVPGAFSSALRYEMLAVAQLVNASYVRVSRDTSRRLSLATLDGRVGGYLEQSGALAPQFDEFARNVRPEDIKQLIRRFLACAEDWEQLTYPQLTSSIRMRNAMLLAERRRNAVLYIFPDFGAAYRLRLQTCTLRRALRLAAWTMRFCHDRGAWPKRLSNAVPSSATNEIIDPMSGEEFVFGILNGAPSIRSVRIHELPSTNEGDGLLFPHAGKQIIYFPAQPHR